MAYALLAAAMSASVCHADTIGDRVDLGQIYGTRVSTGPGPSNAGTIRVITASDSPSGSITFPAGALPTTSTYTVISATGGAKESFLPVRLVRADGSAFYDAAGAAVQVVAFSSGSLGFPLYVITTSTLPVSFPGGLFGSPFYVISTNTIVSGSSVTVVNSTVSLNGVGLLATAAAQVTSNGSLSSIDGKITAVNTGAVSFNGVAQPVSGGFFQNTQPVVMPTTFSFLGSSGTLSNPLYSQPASTVTTQYPAGYSVLGTSGTTTNPLYAQPTSTVTTQFPAGYSVNGTSGTLANPYYSQPTSTVTTQYPAGYAFSFNGTTFTLANPGYFQPTSTVTTQYPANYSVLGASGSILAPLYFLSTGVSVNIISTPTVTLGGTLGRAMVLLSSTAITTVAGGNGVVLSSFTVPAGKTLFVHHMDGSAFTNVPSTGPVLNIGDINIFTTNPYLWITSFTVTSTSGIWLAEFGGDFFLAAGTTLASSATMRGATVFSSATFHTFFHGDTR